MAGLDDLLQPNTQNLGGTDLTFTDADTLVDSSKLDAEGKPLKYRIRGINAGEALHPGVETSGYQAGSAEQTTQVSSLANQFGYDRVVETGETDEFGRAVVDLQDKHGRSFANELAKAGVVDIHPGFDPGSTLGDAKDYAEFLRTSKDYQPDEWDQAAAAVKGAIKEEERYSEELYSGIRKDFQVSDYDRTDVDEEGNSLSPLSTAWDTSMLGVSEALYGMASLLGDTFGWDDLKEYGEIGGAGKRYQIGDQGAILTDYKDIDGFGDAASYLANNAIISLPYLGITALSALAAPATGGLSLLAPAGIYTGQAWNEMGQQIKEAGGGERSASIAIMTGVTQAALDRLGLAGIAGKGGGELYKNGVKELVRRGMSKEVAEETLATATKRQLAELSGDLAKVAASQVTKKKTAMELLKAGGKGLASEATTEALQEAIAAIGADIGSGQAIDWDDVQDRAIQGAVAGGALGGAFGTAGGALQQGQWANLAYQADREDPNDVADSTRYAREEEQNLGYVPTIQELAARNREAPDALETLEDRANRHKETQKKRGVGEVVQDVLTSAPALWRGATRNIFSKDLQAKSRAARQLADMFGGNLQRIFGGANYESAKAHRQAIYKNMVMIPAKAYTALNGGRSVSSKNKATVSDNFYRTVQDAMDEKGNVDFDKIPDSDAKPFIVQMVNDLKKLSDQMYQDQSKYNPDLGYINNYLLKYKAIEPNAVRKNRSEFIEALKSEYGVGEAEARDIADRIIDGTTQDLDEAFSVVKGGPVPKSHKKRSFGLSENKKFQKFVERDLYNNINQATKAATRYVAYQEFVGDNASHISKLLQQMQQEGVPSEVVDKVAAQMQDYLDAESGNYKRPTSEMGRNLIAWQKNFMTFTTLAGLPLATVSSFVELALTQRGLTKDQIFGKGGLKAIGKELAQGMYDTARNSVTKDIEQNYQSDGRQILQNLGFYDWDVGAATTTGVSETHAWHQPIYEFYFKIIGLSQWTNYTRAVRASIAGDFIIDNMDVYLSQDPDAPITNQTREAEEKLRNLGIDVSRALPAIKAIITGTATPEQQTEFEGQLREAQYNFINEAVALPGAANRPLLYQDPRFALFTQFQGFVSTFTANHIPRLWNEYIQRGSPAMRYQTFAMMVTMIGLGFASQYLKDLLKHGGENPYLDEVDIIQRGIRASGLLGTSERVIDQFFPIYETRSRGAGEWLWNTASGEAPVTTTLKRGAKAVGSAFEGDVDDAAKYGLKTVVGPLYDVGNNFVDSIGG